MDACTILTVACRPWPRVMEIVSSLSKITNSASLLSRSFVFRLQRMPDFAHGLESADCKVI